MITPIELPLSRSFVDDNEPRVIRARLKQIVRSLKFTWHEGSYAFRIEGPDTSYHAADPDLAEVLSEFDLTINLGSCFDYRSRRDKYDLCFEDCWSGYFISDELAKNDKDLILIHLDDHEDMMPTFLTWTPDGVFNLATGRLFNPKRSHDWVEAIKSGCVSIGDFITPLYFAGCKVHVRHLNNLPEDSSQPSQIVRAPCSYPEVTNYQFASLQKVSTNIRNGDGTYRAGDDPESLLKDLPEGKVILHIDLDYFINDFNGNIGTSAIASQCEMRRMAKVKLSRFFTAIKPLQSRLQRCVIATSPGFCSVRHWNWLLKELGAGLPAGLSKMR